MEKSSQWKHHPSVEARGVEKTFAITAKKLDQNPTDLSNSQLKKLIENLTIGDDGSSVESGCSSEALSSLVKRGCLNRSDLVSKLVNNLPSAKCKSHIMSLIIQLLHDDVQCMVDQKSTSAYSLASHPLISIVTSAPTSWCDLLVQIRARSLIDDNEVGLMRLLRPFLVHLLCSKHTDELIQYQTPNLLYAIAERERDALLLLLVDSIPLISLPQSTFNAVISFIHTQLTSVNASNSSMHRYSVHRFILQIFSLCDQLKSDEDRIFMMKMIKSLVMTSPLSDIEDGICLLIAHWICHASPSVLAELLDLVVILLNSVVPHMIFVLAVKVAILQAFTYRKSVPYAHARVGQLLNEALKVCDDIIDQQRKEQSKAEDNSVHITYRGDVLYRSMPLLEVMRAEVRREADSSKTVKLYSNMVISHATASETAITINTILLYRALTGNDNDDDEGLMEILVDLSKQHLYITHVSVPVFLYMLHSKLATVSTSKKMIRILPQLVNHHTCVPPILKTIKNLTTHPNTLPTALRMMHALWRAESRCYTRLLRLLSVTSNGNDVTQAVRAVIMRDVCTSNPDLRHASDMLALIDDVIAGSADHTAPGVVAMAIDAMRGLCASEALSIVSAWRMLEKRELAHGAHVASPVTCAVLKLLALTPTLESGDKEFIEFKRQALTFIWSHAASTSSSAGRVRGTAMMALSCFRFSDFLNAHLPPALRPSFDDEEDADDDVTMEEVLESSISGSTLVSLIEADEVTSDHETECSALLTAMMRQEMEEMPRDIKSRAMRSQLRHQQDNNALAKLPHFMLKAYEKNRQPNLRSIFASGLLMCYNPEVEIHSRTGNLVRASVVANGRNFLRKLPALLSEVTLDPKGWQAISIAEEAWKTMMRRCYNAVFDGRAAELAIQMEKVKSGEQEGDIEDVEAEIAACGLWARDRVMDKLKAASKETSSMQGNALLGLAGLIQVVVQRANQAAANDAVAAVGSGMISNQLWLLKACDTILSAVDCGYQCGSNSKPFSWCQYRSVSNTGGLTSTQIGRICAMHGMHTCVDVLYKCDVERVRALLDRFKLFLSNETLTNLHTNVHMHMTVACGRVLALLHTDDRYNAITNIQTRALINTCTDAVVQKACSDENKNGADAAKDAGSDSNDSDDDSDESDDDDEDFSEARLAFMTSCCVIMCQQFASQRPDVQYKAVEVFLTIRRIVMELKDMSANYSKTLCSLLVLLTTRGWKTDALSEADFKQTLKLIEKRHKISPNDAVINECLGMLLHTFIPSDTKDVYTEKWISSVSNNKIPTKQRLSALTGIAASIGSQSLHMFASSKQQTTQQVDDEHKQQIMKIVKLLTDVIENGRDVGVTGKTVTLLSRLYLSYQVLAQSASANMPRNLSYLPDTSVMKSAFQLVVRIPSSSWRYTCIYKTFVQIAQQYTLPPVDWNATIFSKQQRSTAITDWCRYQLILTQAHENTTCASLLSTSISAQLTNEERCLFYKNLSVFSAYSSTHDTLSSLLRLVHTDLTQTSHINHDKFIRAYLTGLRRLLDACDITVQPCYRQLQSTLRTCYDVMPVFATDELWCELAACVEKMHVGGGDEFTTDDSSPLRALRLCGERVKNGGGSLHHHIALVLRCCASVDDLPVLAAVVASCCAVMKAEQHVTWIHHVISELRRCGDDAMMTSSLVKMLAVSVNVVSCRLDSKSSLKDFSIPYLARQPICDISMTSLSFTSLNVLTQQYYGANLADDVTACMVQLVCEKRLHDGEQRHLMLVDSCLKQAIVAVGNCGQIKLGSDLRRKVLTFMLL